MMSVITAVNLKKNYGKFQALKGLNLDVKKGEVFGFIGPNGAGKTTTIRILLGLLRKSGGQATLFDADVWKDSSSIHERLAYIPSEVNLWPMLSGGEVIDLLAKLRGKLDVKRKSELIERFQLDPTKKCKTYSKGNRQKVAIISAFISDVDLLILDEPTSGLDPLMELQFQDCVMDAKNAGKTVFLSSHILSEVEKLCDRISIIKAGTIIESNTMAQLRLLTLTQFTVDTKKPAQPSDFADIKGLHDVEIKEGKICFRAEKDAIDEALLRLSKFGVGSLTSNPPTLEELFMQHYSA
jgi:ABC-2 type transport system ATP-binding protein